MTAKNLIISQIQSQMEQAVQCIQNNQPGAAQLAYLECASLCQQLELERAMQRQPQPQLTIDLSPVKK